MSTYNIVRLVLLFVLFCEAPAVMGWKRHSSTTTSIHGSRVFHLIPRCGEILQPPTLEDVEEIIESNNKDNKLVVIDFYSQNCPPCKKVAPLYLELSESDEFRDKVVFCKIDVDQVQAATKKFGITGWPTFLFIKNGEVQTEIVGGKLAEATLYDWVKLLVPKGEPMQAGGETTTSET